MGKRSYEQNCALAIALDLIGERWTLLIIRELLLGEARYGDLLENLPGVGTNLLAARLRELVDKGLVERVQDGGHPTYRLTDSGADLEPAVLAMIRWGMRFTDLRDQTVHQRGRWILLPLRALVDPERGRRWRGAYRLEVDGQATTIRFGERGLEFAGPADKVVATITMGSTIGARVANSEVALEQAIQAGDVEVQGEEEEIERFFRAFPVLA